MKNEAKIVKCVNTKREISDFQMVVIKNGVGRCCNSQNVLEFKTELEDGVYLKDFFEKSLIQTTKEVAFIPEDKANWELTGVLSKQILESLKKAVLFVGNDVLRPTMSGVFVSEKALCATDANKLFWKNEKVGFKNSCILTVECIKILSEAKSEIKIWEEVGTPTHIKFECDEFTLISSLIDGKFPNYEAVIPKVHEMQVKMNAKMLMDSLKVVNEYSNKNTHKVRFVFDHVKVTMLAEDLDRMTEKSISIDLIENTNKEIYSMAFNGRFLLQSLKALDKGEDVVILNLTSPSRAGTINDKILLMPVMDNN